VLLRTVVSPKNFGWRVRSLKGTLKDPIPLPIPGLELELLQSGKAVKQTKTTDGGKFNFGEVPPGIYQMRIVSMPFCAPKIDCRSGSCVVATQLRLNEKLAKPVLVE
jgi:hypothetical protein